MIQPLGIMMVQLNLLSQQKVNCWDTFTFNNSTCTWDNDGTTQPAAPEKVNCWDTFTFNNTSTWDNDGTTKAPEKVNCWDTHFQHLYLYLG
jgi:hypothetical protein